MLQKQIFLYKGSYRILYCNHYAVAKKVRKSSIWGNAMYTLQAIVMLAALNNIEIESCWIWIKKNVITDLLSCGMNQKLANKYLNFQAMINKNLQTNVINI